MNVFSSDILANRIRWVSLVRRIFTSKGVILIFKETSSGKPVGLLVEVKSHMPLLKRLGCRIRKLLRARTTHPIVSGRSSDRKMRAPREPIQIRVSKQSDARNHLLTI